MTRDEARHPRIAVVTGSRAEFGLLRGVIERLECSEHRELSLIVAGLHLDPAFGHTVDEVAREFSVAARVSMSPPGNSRADMALAVARGLEGFTRVFSPEATRPDLVVVLGDRTEPFAASLAAAYLGIEIAHIHGGDVSGDPIDDFQRDAISRLAGLHFPATESSAGRLRRLDVRGELQVVGAPGLDAIVDRTFRSREEVQDHLGLETPGWVVLLQHSNPHHPDSSGPEYRESLEAVLEFAESRGETVVLLYPNNDAGHQDIVSQIESHREDPRCRVYPSLGRDLFLDLLHHATLLVGNSSAGLIESRSLRVPAVDLGDRQRGRERDGNVVEAEFSVAAILEACERALKLAERESTWSQPSVYGDGRASERIAERLESWRPPGAVPVILPELEVLATAGRRPGCT